MRSSQKTANRLRVSKQWLLKMARENRVDPPGIQMDGGRNAPWYFDPRAKIVEFPLDNRK
jgi:hypothetical protein